MLVLLGRELWAFHFPVINFTSISISSTLKMIAKKLYQSMLICLHLNTICLNSCSKLVASSFSNLCFLHILPLTEKVEELDLPELDHRNNEEFLNRLTTPWEIVYPVQIRSRAEVATLDTHDIKSKNQVQCQSSVSHPNCAVSLQPLSDTSVTQRNYVFVLFPTEGPLFRNLLPVCFGGQATEVTPGTQQVNCCFSFHVSFLSHELTTNGWHDSGRLSTKDEETLSWFICLLLSFRYLLAQGLKQKRNVAETTQIIEDVSRRFALLCLNLMGWPGINRKRERSY